MKPVTPNKKDPLVTQLLCMVRAYTELLIRANDLHMALELDDSTSALSAPTLNAAAELACLMEPEK